MGLSLATTHHHPYGEGAEHKSAGELVKLGHEAHRSYKHVAKELQELANINRNKNPMAHSKFNSAAMLAREKAHGMGEYKEDKKKMYA